MASPLLGVAISFVASVVIFQDVLAGHTFNGSVYTWLTSGETCASRSAS